MCSSRRLTSVGDAEDDSTCQDLDWAFGGGLKSDTNKRDKTTDDDGSFSAQSRSERPESQETHDVAKEDTCRDPCDVARVCRVADVVQEVRVGENTTDDTCD
jgi:hypothetical protein